MKLKRIEGHTKREPSQKPESEKCSKAESVRKENERRKNWKHKVNLPDTDPDLPVKTDPYLADMDHPEVVATANEVLAHLTACMRGEIREEMFMSQGIGMGETIIKRLRRQITPRDRIKAAELLGKRYGLYNDRVLLEGIKQVVFSGEDELED